MSVAYCRTNVSSRFCRNHTITSRQPSEKYVTRAEYDELRGRFDELAAQVQRLLPAVVPSYYQMGIPSGLSGASTEAVPTYATTGPLLYQPVMHPPYTQHLDASPQGPHQRFIKPEDTQVQSRHHQSAMGPTASGAAPMHSSPTLNRPRPKSPTTTATKHSPLSLASITSPYHPDAQSKNCHAQTLMLGERLRPGSRALEGPAVLSSEMTPLLQTRRRSQERRRRYISITALQRPSNHRLYTCTPREDITNPLIARRYQHGTTTGNH